MDGHRTGERHWLRCRREEIAPAELIAAASARCRLRDLTIDEPEIEASMRWIYGESR